MGNGHVLVVGGRDHTLDKIEKLGVRYSMMQVPSLVNERQRGGATRYAVLDYRDHAEALALARAWHAADPFDAVVSFTEHGLEPASRCAADLGVSGDNLPAVLVTRDKRAMRDELARHGLSPVRYRLCDAPADARAFLRGLAGQPMVLKPHDGGLSEGVCVVGDETGLDEGWRWARAATAGPILAEEFLAGTEYSVESISRDGAHEVVTVTEKVTTPLPRFIELAHRAPAPLDDDLRARIAALVTTFLDVVGQRTGPAHTEIRLTPAGPRIIESQTRFGGDQIWEICELVTGVDLMSETVATLLGLPMPPRTPAAAAAAIRFFAYENVHVADVHGLDAARATPGLVRLTCSLRPGQTLAPLTSSDSRQGYALCTGATLDEAIARADRAHDLVRVVCEPLLPEVGSRP
jgi:biotin carboxylase